VSQPRHGCIGGSKYNALHPCSPPSPSTREACFGAKIVCLAELAGVGPSTVKVLGPVCMVAEWAVAWPRHLVSLPIVDPFGCCKQLP
jgi:hypothetical protein